MTLRYRTGDLLNSEFDALVNPVNTVGVMGKGLALSFKNRYPEMFKAYAQACRRGEVQIGRMHLFALPEPVMGPRFIINFPTKHHWRDRSLLGDIRVGLNDLRAVIETVEIRSLALPALGCGNGGLPWSSVELMLVEFADSIPQVRVDLYDPGHNAAD